MSDPSNKLQSAIVARLKGDATLAALVGKRIYDEVQAEASFPYISLGGGQVIGDDDDCVQQSEVTFEIHVWTRPPSAGPMMKRIAGAVRDAMKADLIVDGFDNLVQQFQQVRWLDDPDGLTRHAVIEFRFIIVHS